ncbi:hypothetical protein RRG08_030162 [Elysia crispata]|uniref:Uncharacterized protein n=1 Tax=Elysia crispata TaxID=231223 RepID=A0AAE0ZR64_9GAST|nr:hypothetical protein RRG08_030162 [Elysia crispata]
MSSWGTQAEHAGKEPLRQKSAEEGSPAMSQTGKASSTVHNLVLAKKLLRSSKPRKDQGRNRSNSGRRIGTLRHIIFFLLGNNRGGKGKGTEHRVLEAVRAYSPTGARTLIDSTGDGSARLLLGLSRWAGRTTETR